MTRANVAGALASAAGWVARRSPRPAGAGALADGPSVSSVVVPRPAGAETSVGFDAAPRSSCPLSRARGTRSGRGFGT